MKNFKVFFLLITLVSCNTHEHEALKVVSSLEEYLQIDRTEDRGNMKERLIEIEKVVKRQEFLEKSLVPIFSPDTISIDSTFTVGWTMASFNPTSLPTVIVKSNDGVDTIFFDQECVCFPIEISEVAKGVNAYYGEVHDNGRKFVFEGWFYAKQEELKTK